MSSVALLITVVAIIGLLLLDRRKPVQTSVFLWLPVLWFSIVATRPISVWLAGPSASGMLVEAALDGNATDAAVFGGLLAAGLIVLFGRRVQAAALIRANPVIVVYFAYCLMSVVWSPFPGVAIKRWTKAVGDLVMILVVLTDAQPIEALRRLFSRAGAVLLPASIFLIRYTSLGRGFDPDGHPMNTGVTTNKNSLGLLVFVVGLSVVWSTWTVLRDKGEPNRGRRLLSGGMLFAFVLAVLWMAQSATALVCFVLGSALIVVTSLRPIERRPAAAHMLMLTLALAGGLTALLGGKEAVFSALGRDSNLTGRTEIWSMVISLAQNSVFGTGFESFWNASIRAFQTQSDGYMFRNINSAHNGYIDVYFNLGLVGVCLIVAILVSGYLRACAALRRRPEVGGLLLGFVVTAAFYSVTEAGFRMLSPAWICLLLAAVAGSDPIAGVVGSGVMELPNLPLWRRNILPPAPVRKALVKSQPGTVESFGGGLRNL